MSITRAADMSTQTVSAPLMAASPDSVARTGKKQYFQDSYDKVMNLNIFIFLIYRYLRPII